MHHRMQLLGALSTVSQKLRTSLVSLVINILLSFCNEWFRGSKHFELEICHHVEQRIGSIMDLFITSDNLVFRNRSDEG